MRGNSSSAITSSTSFVELLSSLLTQRNVADGEFFYPQNHADVNKTRRCLRDETKEMVE